MDWREKIEMNPKVLYGKPVIKGTRIGVDLIIEKLAFGESLADIIKAYPQLDTDKVYACLAYATALIRDEETYYIETV